MDKVGFVRATVLESVVSRFIRFCVFLLYRSTKKVHTHTQYVMVMKFKVINLNLFLSC